MQSERWLARAEDKPHGNDSRDRRVQKVDRTLCQHRGLTITQPGHLHRRKGWKLFATKLIADATAGAVRRGGRPYNCFRCASRSVFRGHGASHSYINWRDCGTKARVQGSDEATTT